MKQLRLFPPCILFTFLFFLNIFTVKAEKPSVIFSQLFYDPPYEERMWFEYADSVHHNGEFIELYNLSAKTIDLSRMENTLRISQRIRIPGWEQYSGIQFVNRSLS